MLFSSFSYGHINFGLFRVSTAPLTHVSVRVPSPGSEADSFPQSDSQTTPRRVAGERALAATRRGVGINAGLITGSNQAFHIIVIGAGMAGLMVARQLNYFGAKVTLLESRVRSFPLSLMIRHSQRGMKITSNHQRMLSD